MTFTATTILTLRKPTNNLKTISLNYSQDFEKLPSNTEYVSKLLTQLQRIQSEFPIINDYSIEFINQQKVENLPFSQFINSLNFGDDSYNLSLMSLQQFELILKLLLSNPTYKSYSPDSFKHIELSEVIAHQNKPNNSNSLIVYHKKFKKRNIDQGTLDQLLSGELDDDKILVIGETPITKKYRGEVLRIILTDHPNLLKQNFIILPTSYNFQNRYASFGEDWIKTQADIIPIPKTCPITRKVLDLFNYTINDQNLTVFITEF